MASDKNAEDMTFEEASKMDILEFAAPVGAISKLSGKTGFIFVFADWLIDLFIVWLIDWFIYCLIWLVDKLDCYTFRR